MEGQIATFVIVIVVAGVALAAGYGLGLRRSARRDGALVATPKALYDVADGIIVTLDRAGLIRVINPTGAALLGYDQAALIGEDWFARAIPEEARPGARAFFDRIVAGLPGQIGHYENEVATATGERRLIGWHTIVLCGPDGRVAGTLSNGRDITETRRAEAALRRSEARNRAIVDAAVDGIITIDETGRIGTFNRAAEAIFGWRAGEVIGSNINVLMPEPYHSQHDAYLQRYRTTGERRIIGIGREVQGRRKDGSVFPLDIAISEAELDGTRLFAGILRDITRRKAIEEALRRAKEEAEQASGAKTRFLAAASHDLRQPMQALFFFSASLVRVATGRARTIALDIERTVRGMSALLDYMLDISKLDAGLVTPEIADVPIGPLVERLHAEFSPAAAAAGIAFHLVPSSAVVRSDPTLLARIVGNLIANAVRYTQAGRILVGCRRANGRVRLMVCDTGIGIPSDQLSTIFEEFYQVGGTPSRDAGPGKGLGLGLAIVKRLAHLLGHTVRVHSVSGRGSAFTVEMAEGSLASGLVSPAAAEPAGRPRQRQTVLLIDDEPTVLAGMAMLLADWDFDVIPAHSQDEALAAIEAGARRPNALVVDYRLADGRTGLQAVAAIRARLGAAVPALMITGDTAPDRLREAEASGLAVLHKPVRPQDFEAALRETLAAEAAYP